jgi:hypothetical protein
MKTSIHNTSLTDKPKLQRFRRLDNEHISAIESLYRTFPFLKERVEIHMPFQRAKSTFSSGSVWLWPKFDKRPVGYLIFMEGFAPCIWYPDRQEGMTFRWLLPPTFSQQGPTICLANILTSESILQIEDILTYHGKDLWSHYTFSERWKQLQTFWTSLPADQPLLAFTPRVVQPIALEDWSLHYDSTIYWIIQPDHSRQPRWYWKDTVTVPSHPSIQYIPPKLKRNVDIPTILCAQCSPYTKMILPDIYSLTSQEGTILGIASIPNIELSHELRSLFSGKISSIPVEVTWNPYFQKYQIKKTLPNDTPITTASFFNHSAIS